MTIGLRKSTLYLTTVFSIIILLLGVTGYSSIEKISNEVDNLEEVIYDYINKVNSLEKDKENLNITINELTYELNYVTSQPNITGNITLSKILSILRDELGAQFKYHNQDTIYNTTTVDEVRRFIDDNREYFRYTKHYFDCDDFALRLYGQFTYPDWASLSIGYATFKTQCDNDTSIHAVLIFIDNNYDVWIIDYYNVKRIPDNWELKFVII